MTDSRQALPGGAQALLDAVIAISSDLDLHSVLARIVESAAELTSAQYAALGVVDRRGGLSDFITTGLDADQRAQIGDLPHGRGILGLLIEQPEALRLDDLHEHPSSYGFPAHHPPMHSFLGVPVRIRGTVFGNLYLTEKKGGTGFTEQDEFLVGALAAAAGYVIDNARAFGLSERRRQWLEASAELTEALQPPIDPTDALDRIAQVARSVSGAVATAIVDPAPGSTSRTTAADDHDAARIDTALDELDRRLDSAGGPSEVEVGELSAVVIPLRAHLARGGALVTLFEAGHGPLAYEERELLASFADQAALALDRAQALADREELAVISDRERIARDLHDVVIQRLFASGMQLQSIRAAAEHPEVIARIDRTVEDLDQTIRDIRRTIFELQDRNPGSVRHAVTALIHEYGETLGVTPRLTTSGPLDTAVGPELFEHLLAVLREALSNVARHAGAKAVEVTLEVADGTLRLSVSDDGVGPPSSFTGNGLRNARQRAGVFGGSLDVSQASPHGTLLTWAVPVG
ncbi:GAF domain-containing protein [Nocardioides sp.]|uniref:GAF domain-containing sensor histidine kinase n=1 Tax=Nocardioides sp. TaxID=35761 RepID=UPI0035694638